VEKVELSAQDYWRAVVLYGANVATYKIALATALIDFAKEHRTFVSMEELARSFFVLYRDRLASGQPQQSNPGRKTVLERVVEEGNAGTITEDQAITRVEKQGFNDVVPRFHTVNGAPIGTRFYEATPSGLTLTDDLLELFTDRADPILGSEVESRWDLLEAAFAMGLPTETLATDEESIFRKRAGERINVTGTRPVLHGYQNGACFYCGEPLLDDIHVDHVIPRTVVQHDEIWNLVLAHSRCNLLKSDLLPSPAQLEHLYQRNEYYIASNHPIKRHLIAQMGATSEQRRVFLQRQYHEAGKRLIHVWRGPAGDIDISDPLAPLGLIAGA
jgi:5-methylcytosine-specific restriction endonuclease McrA